MLQSLARINERAGRSESGHVPGKMPNWPDGVRAIPNALLRSPLFAAIGRGPRRYVERQEIGRWGDVKIRYTGPQLDQSDLSVWMAVLHIARQQTIAGGHACRVTAYRLLGLLGRTDSGKNREILQRQLSRLSATAIELNIGEYGFEGSLIDEVHRDNVSRAYLIHLNQRLDTLFQQNMSTWVDWAVRNELNGQPLAQWLHSFYSTHAQPYSLKIETIHSLCGSEAVCMRDFSKALRKSLDAVGRALKRHGAIFKWEIHAGLVRVQRSDK